MSVKYFQYNEDYESLFNGTAFSKKYRQEFCLSGNPHLYDALLTGCKLPFTRPSFLEYNQDTEADIKKIVELTPQSLNCILGSLRCTTKVPPLYMACLNDKLPLHVVEFLLEKGANAHAEICDSEEASKLIDALKQNAHIVNANDPQRLTHISALFEKARCRPIKDLNVS